MARKDQSSRAALRYSPSLGEIQEVKGDNATLNLSIIPAGALKVKVYAVNYNILRIMSGMAGLLSGAKKLHGAAIWALVAHNSFVLPALRFLLGHA